MKMLRVIALMSCAWAGVAFGAAVGGIDVYVRNDSPGHDVEVSIIRGGRHFVTKTAKVGQDTLYVGRAESGSSLTYKIFGGLKTYSTETITWDKLAAIDSNSVLLYVYKGMVLPGVELQAFTGAATIDYGKKQMVRAANAATLADIIKSLETVATPAQNSNEQNELNLVLKHIDNAGLSSELADRVVDEIVQYQESVVQNRRKVVPLQNIIRELKQEHRAVTRR